MVSTSPHSTTIRTPTLSRSSSRTTYLYTAWQLGISLKRKFSRLVNYANDSGGDIYYAAQSAAMERLYSRITEEARHEYTWHTCLTATTATPVITRWKSVARAKASLSRLARATTQALS